MMKNFRGGDTVKRGFYASATRWTVEMVEENGRALPGEAGERYVRVSALGLLILAPLMGAGFVIFLPLAGFVLLGSHVYRWATSTPEFISIGRRREAVVPKS